MNEPTLPLPRVEYQPRPAFIDPAPTWGDDLDYRALFEQTGDCVFIIGLDLRYLAANPQGLSLLGYEKEELVGMPVSSIMSLDENPDQEAFPGENPGLYERILKRKDGSTLPVEIRTSIVYNDRNQPSYIQSIARDISERKQAEKVLRRHTRILSALSEATARLLRTTNIETKIPEMLESLGEAMDVSCCAIFEIDGFSDDPAVRLEYQWNRNDLDGFDVPGTIGPILPSLLNAPGGRLSSDLSSTGRAMLPDLEFSITPIQGTLGSWGFLGLFDRQPDSSIIPFERDAIQTAANLIGSTLQRNRFEETIRLSEARNRIIIDALPDLLIRIDPEATILDYSATPAHSLYLHREMICGRKLSQIWPEETVSRLLGGSNRRAFNDTHWVEGFHLPNKDRTYESRLYPISSDEALIVIRDVTEQDRLNQAKTDFINRASHELRTPLTSAMLMVDLIQEGGTPQELGEYWQILHSELNRQKILIDRLLMAGRLEDGMLKLERSALDLGPVLEEAVLAVKSIANKRRVSLRLEPAGGPMIVLGDKSGLGQVFINLINNAAKFSPEGGEVQIRAFEGEADLRVSITDHGLGIPAEALPHLFERFYRARNVTVAEIPGSGIGLYIVKAIVEELGGAIEVASELNRGTVFTVCLKRPEAPA
jgi:PAS domain S-box-containing protein